MVLLQPDGFYHPANEAEVIELIQFARKNGYELRVKGSGHSVPHAIYTDGFPYRQAEYYSPSDVANRYRLNFQPVTVPEGQVPVLLDKMNAVEFYDETDESGATVTRVRAQAGVHLGKDPYDPTETSTFYNSLFYQMDQRGLAVRDMGGITHQTVGGFLATGSAGGSLQHSLEPNIYGFRFVDGTGTVHECSRTKNPDLFAAVGVSMGLLGVVTEVTFTANPRFDIIGEEHIRPVDEYKGWIEFFSDGPKSLTNFLKETEYSRLLWWPQKGTKKMTVWQARTMQDTDYRAPRSIVVNNEKTFIPKPYQEVNWVFGSPLLLENLGNIFYTAVAWWPTYLYKFIKTAWLRMFVQSGVETFWYSKILPILLSVFVPTDKKNEDGSWEPQKFWDTWWRGLPMDNQMDDRLMGVVFTEIWVPLEHTTAVMKALRDHYDSCGLSATGTFSCELYATKASEFWMSPSYGTEVFRVDLFLSSTDLFSPKEYYQQFWDLLAPYDFRTHWGKWQPGASDDPKDAAKWREYLHKQYPKWDAFLEKRNELDPDQVFVNHYWRHRFGIPQPAGFTESTPLEWKSATPPHLIKPPEQAAALPNQALILGRPPLPSPPAVAYVVMTLIAGATFAGVCWFMTDLTTWFTWASPLAMMAITAVVALFVGIGTLRTRQWGPLLMVLITLLLIFFANIANAVFGSPLWEWHPIMGLSTLLSAIIGEIVESIITPTVTWLLGGLIFRKYWPK